VRTSAGAYARRKRIELLLLLGIGAGIFVGLGIAQVLHGVMGAWLDAPWVPAGVSCAILVAMWVFWRVFRSIERGRLDHLKKGEEAETYAGQVIEYAITAPNCAIAHSVTTIARVGDIDHLVATPVRLWVIETKYRKVPPEHFPEVLRRIAENTAAVRKWAPPGTPVRGCLVLAKGSPPKRRTYDNGQTVVHTPGSLARKLKAEAREERTIDEQVANEVWKLGQVAE